MDFDFWSQHDQHSGGTLKSIDKVFESHSEFAVYQYLVATRITYKFKHAVAHCWTPRF